jgi:hypothetical protein
MGGFSGPQAHSRVSNINFDICFSFCGGGSLLTSHGKYIPDGKSLKISDNTFDLSPKWARTLPYGIYFS